MVVTGTTNSAGQAYFQFKVTPAAPLGTYAVLAAVSATGYTAVGVSGNFTVN